MPGLEGGELLILENVKIRVHGWGIAKLIEGGAWGSKWSKGSECMDLQERFFISYKINDVKKYFLRRLI